MGKETESDEVVETYFDEETQISVVMDSTCGEMTKPLDPNMVNAVSAFIAVACEEGRAVMVVIPTDGGVQTASNVHESEWISTLESLVTSLKLTHSPTVVEGNESQN